MTQRQSTILAWSLCALALAAVAAGFAFSIADAGTTVRVAGAPPHTTRFDVGGPILAVLLVAGFAVVGAIVASRLPGNPIGWFLCAIPVLIAGGILAELGFWHDAGSAGGVGAIGELSAWYQNWFWIPLVVMVFSGLPLLFPTGRAPTPRWRYAGRLALAAGGLLLFDAMFRKGQLENVDWVQRNPVGLVAWPQAVGEVAMAVWGVSALLAVASVLVRFRRSHGVERQQLKWFAAAIVLATALYLINVPFSGGSSILLAAAGLSVVGGVAIAILRYRLYDIDVVINRALVYGSLTVALGAAYLGSVLLLQLALAPVTSQSQIAVAASTLAVAALFRPARAQIQSRVDRRFFRRRYDAAQTLAAFGSRVRDEVDLDALGGELRAVVADSVQPAHVALWLREGGS
jgi:hypothetical protein